MQKLEMLRQEIEAIDASIIEKLAERKRVCEEIGQAKMEMGKAVLDPVREEQLLNYRQKLCAMHQLDPVFVENVFEIILSYSRELQR